MRSRSSRAKPRVSGGGIDEGDSLSGRTVPASRRRRRVGQPSTKNGAADLRCAIQSISALGEVCGATAFMAWCQNTLVWYAANSDNPELLARFGDKFASGKILGGTGLSNPMKSFFGIEKLKLKGPQGRWRLHRAAARCPGCPTSVPIISSERFSSVEDAPGGIVMFLADCSDPAISLQPCKPFLAMDGTGTYRRPVPRRVRVR